VIDGRLRQRTAIDVDDLSGILEGVEPGEDACAGSLETKRDAVSVLEF
jgi:hypothetical protein